MTNDFVYLAVGDIAKVKGGKRLPKGQRVQDKPTRHPYIRVTDFASDGLNTSAIKYIDEAVFRKISRYIITSDDVYISIAGTIGLVGIVPRFVSGANLTENAAKICQIGPRFDKRFLMYYLRSQEGQSEIRARVVGTSQPKLALFRIKEIPVPAFPTAVQRKIAAILSVYDDLIENNNRRIKVLEEMARRIYREWFVHFRFPGHENVRMVDSELGPIPAGWEVKRLGEVVELAYGKGLRKADRVPGPYPVYGSSGVVDHHHERLVDGPGIIVGRKGNVGTVYWSDEAFYPIDTVFYVNTDVSLYYIYFSLQSQNFQSTDTAVPGLSRNQAYLLPFLVPDCGATSHLESVIEPIFAETRVLQGKNETLRQARDLLLPRLISGEIDVSELDIVTSPLPSFLS